MTLNDLFIQIGKLIEDDPKNGERVVVMSCDSEGNGYSPLAEVATDRAYRESNAYSGEVGYEQLTPQQREAGYGEEDCITDGMPAAVLWPVN